MQSSNITRVQCTRNYICNSCHPAPTLSPLHFVNVSYGKHLVFLGDSVSAQVECDYRQALADGFIFANKVSRKGAYYSSISASSKYIQIGCPWRCKHNNSESLYIKNLGHVLSNSSTTHIILNIGSHYNMSLFQSSLPIYKDFLNAMKDHGIHIIIRTLGFTHFASSPTGDFKLKPNNISTRIKCVPIQNHLDSIIIKQNLLLQELAYNLSVNIMDISGLSDDYMSHATSKDCRHLCQNCDMIRAWNSLLLRYIES